MTLSLFSSLRERLGGFVDSFLSGFNLLNEFSLDGEHFWKTKNLDFEVLVFRVEYYEDWLLCHVKVFGLRKISIYLYYIRFGDLY